MCGVTAAAGSPSAGSAPPHPLLAGLLHSQARTLGPDAALALAGTLLLLPTAVAAALRRWPGCRSIHSYLGRLLYGCCKLRCCLLRGGQGGLRLGQLGGLGTLRLLSLLELRA